MVADLFHFGHCQYIKQIYDSKKNKDYKIYIGIHNDKTVESYKRTPIMTIDERIKVVECCKYVDKVISNAPINISLKYIKKYNIDYIFIPDNRTKDEIKN